MFRLHRSGIPEDTKQVGDDLFLGIHEIGKSSSLWVPQALLEVGVLGGVFVSNRSAGSAALAGVSITSAVSHLADIDQVSASERNLLRTLKNSRHSAEIHNAGASRFRLLWRTLGAWTEDGSTGLLHKLFHRGDISNIPEPSGVGKH